MNNKIVLASFLLLVLGSRASYAAEYTLAIQPILPPDKLEEAYKPLADYLSKETGQTIKLSTFRSFKSYWSNMKRLKGFDMVLDAAHFTDYRVKNSQYKVIAKLPDTVSFTVVTKEDLFVFDVDELASYRMATMNAPGMGGLRLKEMFVNLDKSPTIISSYDADDCIKNIRDGKADAAIIPTSMVGSYKNLNVVIATDPVPHMAFSVSPKVPGAMASTIKKALVDASETKEGREMLAAMKLSSFESASNKVYDGYADLLQIMKKKPAK